MRLLFALLAVPAAAAPAVSVKTVAAPAFSAPAPGEPFWLKEYPTSPYQEIWTGELALKNYDADLAKIPAAIEKGGGKLTQPLEEFVSSKKDKTHQLSFAAGRGRALEIVGLLRKLGELPDPATRVVGAPLPLAEIKAKADRLMKEKVDHAAELAKVPDTAAAAEEILERLLLVEEVAERADPLVRVNLSVKQK